MNMRMGRGIILLIIAIIWAGCGVGGNVPGGTYSAFGQVVDEITNGLPEVELVFSGDLTGTTTTDVNGAWNSVLKGRVVVTPSRDGYRFEPQYREVTNGSSSINFIGIPLEQERTLASVEPVDDLNLLLGTTSEDALSQLPLTTMITDSIGQTYVVELEWALIDFKPSDPGEYLAVGTFVLPPGVSSAEESTVTVTIIVEEQDESYEVSGIVQLNGSGLAGVTISFSEGYGSVITDSDGTWIKAGLDGAVTVTPSMQYYSFSPVATVATKTEQTANFQAIPEQANLDGSIKFHNTNLRLHSTVEIADYNVLATGGIFSLVLPKGEQQYLVKNLLGEYGGEFEHNGTDRLDVAVPPFSGFSAPYFNKLLIWAGDSNPGTIRWERGRTIRVWIQPASTHHRVNQTHVDMAWNTLGEWMNLLPGAIIYQRVYDESQADLKWYWVEPAEIGGAAGLASISYSRPAKLIQAATIKISVDALNHKGVYLHEIGHTVGLAHSDDQEDLMYPILYASGLSGKEINIARLAHSIPSATPPLGTVTGSAFDQSIREIIEDDDLITVVIE